LAVEQSEADEVRSGRPPKAGTASLETGAPGNAGTVDNPHPAGV